MGNRTAWALLASFALCRGLGLAGVEFHALFWLAVDLAVIWAITHAHMGKRDCIIVALFIPAWAFYLLDDPARYYGAASVVALQFLLTFPIRRAWRRAKETPVHDPLDHFDLKVSHGAAT